MSTPKPVNIEYGLEDRPPLMFTLFQGLQHVSAYAIALVFPVVIIHAVQGSPEQAMMLVSISMIAGGIGAIAQARPGKVLGSGYLCPQVCGPSFLSSSILAAQTGGLSLIFGMTAVAGFFEMIFSRFLHRLRMLLPTEVTGVIVTMVGITIIRLAMQNFLGLDNLDSETTFEELTVAIVTLSVMVGLNVWGKGALKQFCVLIGIAVGYIVAIIVGVLPISDFGLLNTEPLFYFPFKHHPGWSFNLHLLLPFLVAMLCSSLKSVGDLTTCQKINDPDWKRPDMQNIRGGILADGLGCFTAGVLGGYGQSTSSTNVGLSLATGATSRVIAYAMGGILIILGFCPKLAAIFAIMPQPVIGAILLFAVVFMVIAGLQIIMSRMLDTRKIFVIGLPILIGLSTDVLPEAFVQAPHWLQPILGSSLSTAALAAVILNLIFRIGIAKKASLSIPSDAVDYGDRIFAFIEKNGGAWAARKDVMVKARSALMECVEALINHHLVEDIIQVEMSFNELRIDLSIVYKGQPFHFVEEKPDPLRILEDESSLLRLSGYLIRRYVDRAESQLHANQVKLSLQLEH
jgi:NCS2 family nucleobase:cation symporter-2